MSIHTLFPNELRAASRSNISYVARLLLAQKNVLAVQLFGSYSRGEDRPSSDCDIIVVADDLTAAKWLQNLEYSFGSFGDGDAYWSAKTLRQDLFQRFFSWPSDLYDTSYFDPFVFSTDWQNEHTLAMFQERGNHRDPEFMQNIARDAITYDPFTRSFPWKN